MWLLPLTQAFAIVILGGLGCVGGTVLAAVIVGYLDRFVAYKVHDGEIKVGLVTIVVIIATLVLQPLGLLGKVADGAAVGRLRRLLRLNVAPARALPRPAVLPPPWTTRRCCRSSAPPTSS